MLKSLGAVIIDPVGHHDAATSSATTEFEVLLYEFKADLNAYLAALGPGAPRQDAEGSHRLQRGAQGSRDAVLRPGDVRSMAEKKGPLTTRST